MATNEPGLNAQTKMSPLEYKVVQSLFVKLSLAIDPGEVAPELRDAGELSDHEAREFLDQSTDRKEGTMETANERERMRNRKTSFMVKVMHNCTWSALLAALRGRESLAHLAQELESALQDQKNLHTQVVMAVTKRPSRYPGRLRQMKFYLHLRRLHLSGEHEAFWKTVRKTDRCWQLVRKNPTRQNEEKLLLYANYAFSAMEKTASQMQLERAPGLQEERLWEGMRSLIPYTSSPAHSTAIYWARKAAADVQSGRDARRCLDDVERALLQTECLAPCHEVAVLHRWRLMLLTRLYSLQPHPQIRQQAMESARRAVFNFGEEDAFSPEEREENFLIVNQRRVFFLLGISVSGADMPGCCISQTDLEEADVVLGTGAAVKNKDYRRRMFDSLALCVLHQRRGAYNEARVRGQTALRLAERGNFRVERETIADRLRRLPGTAVVCTED